MSINNKTLTAHLVVLSLCNGPSLAAVFNTAPVSTVKPLNVSNRNVMCMTQNLDKKQRSVTVEVWQGNGNMPAMLRTDTYTLQPNQTSGWRLDSGVSGGLAQVYCRFKMDKRVKGYLSVEDDFAEVLINPAQ